MILVTLLQPLQAVMTTFSTTTLYNLLWLPCIKWLIVQIALSVHENWLFLIGRGDTMWLSLWEVVYKILFIEVQGFFNLLKELHHIFRCRTLLIIFHSMKSINSHYSYNFRLGCHGSFLFLAHLCWKLVSYSNHFLSGVRLSVPRSVNF